MQNINTGAAQGPPRIPGKNKIRAGRDQLEKYINAWQRTIKIMEKPFAISSSDCHLVLTSLALKQVVSCFNIGFKSFLN